MIIHSEQEMLELGERFTSKLLSDHNATPGSATVLELIGDIGAGKTTFTKGLAKGLRIKEPITSPSFNISKSYALPYGKGHLIHYDFYRLPDPGLMLEDLNENLKDPENIIVVEWSESVKNILPQNRTIVEIKYDNTGGRSLIIKN